MLMWSNPSSDSRATSSGRTLRPSPQSWFTASNGCFLHADCRVAGTLRANSCGSDEGDLGR
jgi:hypothetical protein